MWREDVMYPYVKRNLQASYPARLGWTIIGKDRWNGYEPDFTVERRRKGRVERVVVEVKAAIKAEGSHVDQINKYARNISGGNAVLRNKILVYPSGVDISNIPDDIDVMLLKSFKCNNDGICWYTS